MVESGTETRCFGSSRAAGPAAERRSVRRVPDLTRSIGLPFVVRGQSLLHQPFTTRPRATAGHLRSGTSPIVAGLASAPEQAAPSSAAGRNLAGARGPRGRVAMGSRRSRAALRGSPRTLAQLHAAGRRAHGPTRPRTPPNWPVKLTPYSFSQSAAHGARMPISSRAAVAPSRAQLTGVPLGSAASPGPWLAGFFDSTITPTRSSPPSSATRVRVPAGLELTRSWRQPGSLLSGCTTRALVQPVGSQKQKLQMPGAVYSRRCPTCCCSWRATPRLYGPW